MIKVYGVPGWGSTISELMLTLADIPYQFVDVSGFDHEGTSRELLKTLNPLCQVPTLALENDEIMTETAAIALMVSRSSPGPCATGWAHRTPAVSTVIGLAGC